MESLVTTKANDMNSNFIFLFYFINKHFLNKLFWKSVLSYSIIHGSLNQLIFITLIPHGPQYFKVCADGWGLPCCCCFVHCALDWTVPAAVLLCAQPLWSLREDILTSASGARKLSLIGSDLFKCDPNWCSFFSIAKQTNDQMCFGVMKLSESSKLLFTRLNWLGLLMERKSASFSALQGSICCMVTLFALLQPRMKLWEF